MSAFDEFVAAVEAKTGQKGRRLGKEIRLLCPAHDDHTPSLDVSEGANGQPLCTCRSRGCPFEQIAAATGWTPNGNGGNGTRQIVSVHVYREEAGEPAFEAVRLAPKSFRLRRFDPFHPDTDHDGYVWKLGDTQPTVYRLPELRLEALGGGVAYVVEGEKHADALAETGLTATTAPMGAGKWRPGYAKHFKGLSRVVILPDDDAVGRQHAADIARSLLDLVPNVRVLELWEPGETKQDVLDWLAAALSGQERQQAAELLVSMGERATDAPTWLRRLEPTANEDAQPDRPHSWLPVPIVGTPPTEPPSICGLLYPGKRHLISGESDAGKSMVLHCLQREEIQAGHCVLHFDFEQGRSETLQRLLALGLTEQDIETGFIYVAPDEPIAQHLPDVLAVIEQRRPSIVSFDSFGNLAELHGLDENKRQDIGLLYRTIIEPTVLQTGAAALILDHLAKDPRSNKYAIGSERKVGIPDVHLRAECVAPLGRGRRGIVKLVCKRDRSGHLAKGKLAEVTIDSDANGNITAVITHTTVDTDTSQTWRPTFLMESVSRFLEPLGETGASLNSIETSVTGKRDYIRQAVSTLTADSYTAERPEGRARIIVSVKPYRQPEPAGDTPE
jgi:hypothetical protein